MINTLYYLKKKNGFNHIQDWATNSISDIEVGGTSIHVLCGEYNFV